MKNFFKHTAALTVALILTLFAAIVVSYTPEVTSAPNQQLPLPVSWADATGSNSFGITISAAPTMISSGIVYTPITTNVALSNVTFRLVVRNGLVVGTEAN